MKKYVLKLIKLYQKYKRAFKPHTCKYYPTCSEYTFQAIEKYGVIRGILKGIWRILRCNPFSKGGVDLLK